MHTRIVTANPAGHTIYDFPTVATDTEIEKWASKYGGPAKVTQDDTLPPMRYLNVVGVGYLAYEVED
jgi:hypothetical protein